MAKITKTKDKLLVHYIRLIKMKVNFILFSFLILIHSDMQGQINKTTAVRPLLLSENGNFPNNPKLPVLVYKQVFEFTGNDPASEVEQVFSRNDWGAFWRNGIYNFHHYHSTAHEVLGVYSGWAEVQLGGPENEPLRIQKGDIVVLPAGTAHKRLDSGDNFAVVGAYPPGQDWNMHYGKPEELQQAKHNISHVPLPETDPVYGEKGKMFDFWK
jgi:uncharacterized protein YjlB